MNPIKTLLLLAPALTLASVPVLQAATVDLGGWGQSGADQDNTFTGNGTTGFTELYGDGSSGDGRVDSGGRASFQSDVVMSPTNDTLEFAFTVGSLTTTNASNNAFRVGFRNDDAGTTTDATVHYIFGWGNDNPDARFAGNSGNSNEYSSGSTFDSDLNVAGATRLATGNTSNITVTLTYLSDAGSGNHNYQAAIDWDGVAHTSGTFTRNTDTWDSVYVLTNSGTVNVDGDGYTLSNASVTQAVPEPSAIALLAAGLGGCCLRRRRETARVA